MLITFVVIRDVHVFIVSELGQYMWFISSIFCFSYIVQWTATKDKLSALLEPKLYLP